MSWLSDMFGGAEKRAANEQVKAIDKQIEFLKGESAQNRADLAPFREQGLRGLGSYMDAMGLNGVEAGNQALGMFREQPGYGFALQEGINARDRSAAARGALGSGGYQKELTAFGQGMADQQWGTWLDRLSGLGTMGQNAAAQTGTINQPLTAAIGQGMADQGTARASGIMGANNARLGMFGDLLNFGGQTAGGGGGSSLLRMFGFG